MSNDLMREEDYALLKDLEKAFGRKDSEYITRFLRDSSDKPLLLRVHAVCMLEDVGDESSVPVLTQVLKHDPSPLTRHEAAFTLGQLGYQSAVPSLVEAMFSDVSPIVRHESAVALSSIGDVTALPELQKAIQDKDEDVSKSALTAYQYLNYLTRKGGIPTTGNQRAPKPKIRL